MNVFDCQESGKCCDEHCVEIDRLIFHNDCEQLVCFSIQIVQSALEKLRKPDPSIFQLTLSRLELDSDEAIFLDDTIENVVGARQIGIRSIEVTDPHLHNT